jgi:hypothetical protein
MKSRPLGKREKSVGSVARQNCNITTLGGGGGGGGGGRTGGPVCDHRNSDSVNQPCSHYKYMVLIKVIAIDFFSVVKCVKSCSD